MSEINKDIKDNKKDVLYDPIVFHNSDQIYTIFKKVGAVSAAVFLVTNAISDQEITKRTLREESIAFLHAVTSLVSKQNIELSDLRLISLSYLRIYSVLDMAFWSGLISQMNVSLIQKELNFIYRSNNEFLARQSSKMYFDQSFFSKPEDSRGAILYKDKNMQTVKDIDYKRHINDKGHIKDISVKDKGQKDEEIDSRKLKIISAIKDKGGRVSIKDIISIIDDVSEKTLQRDLLSLVDKGVLIKDGKKRWSVYSIKI